MSWLTITAGCSRVIVLLTDADKLIGHIAAYIRQVRLCDEAVKIGLIGGIVVDPNFRSRGYSKRLLQEAHDIFIEANLPFSVLVAYEPERYRTAGYQLMNNEMRFLEDGEWRQLVYRGGMVAELSERKWPNGLLHLRGPVV